MLKNALLVALIVVGLAMLGLAIFRYQGYDKAMWAFGSVVPIQLAAFVARRR